jgi:hypothetical protein
VAGYTIAGLYAVKCGLADSSLLLHIFVLYTDTYVMGSKKEGFIRAIKCRKMIWVRHVSCAERKAMSLQGNMKAIDGLEDLGFSSRIILKWI